MGFIKADMQKFNIVVHGGAGTIIPERLSQEMEKSQRDALRKAVERGQELLRNNASALDAVEAAVVILEDCPEFNAGRGSVLAHDGSIEMDACIMCGKTLDAGSVAMVEGIKNPVRLSRKIMHHSEHVMLCGDGALEFGRLHKIEECPREYFKTDYRHAQWEKALKRGVVELDHSAEKKYGTVGAVACDLYGNVAAATSTGGLTNKKYGRIGDSPIIGAGTYANNRTCAISCTGFGEFFMIGVIAYDVSCLIEYKGMSLEEACRFVINEKKINHKGDGGLIAVNASGEKAIAFNSQGMYRAFIANDGRVLTEIYR